MRKKIAQCLILLVIKVPVTFDRTNIQLQKLACRLLRYWRIFAQKWKESNITVFCHSGSYGKITYNPVSNLAGENQLNES